MRNVFFIILFLCLSAVAPCTPCMGQSVNDVPREWLNKWQFTGELGASLDKVRVIGDSSAAGSEPGQTYFGSLNVRGEYVSGSGYKLDLNLQSYKPMSDRKKNEEKSRFTATLTKRATVWSLGDMSPRLSQWSLTGKSIFGVYMKRDSKTMGLDLILGKYRKPAGSGPEDHKVAGAGVRWAISDKFIIRSEMIYTFHEDIIDEETFKEKNSVMTAGVTYRFKEGRQIDLQYARSDLTHRTNSDNPESRGGAFRVQGVFAFRKLNVETTFEDVDDGFYTLSGSASSGRRVVITQVSAPLSGTVLFTTGYTDNKTDSGDVSNMPLMLTVKPFRGKTTTVTFDYSKQKCDTEDDESTVDRTQGIRVRHRAGSTLFTVGARGDSIASGATLSRTVSFDSTTLLSETLSMKLKLNREKRKDEDEARNAYRASMTWDISDWTALDISQEIKERPGRTKRIFRTKFKHSDSDSKYEFGLDYRLTRERGVKEHALLADTLYYF